MNKPITKEDLPCIRYKHTLHETRRNSTTIKVLIHVACIDYVFYIVAVVYNMYTQQDWEFTDLNEALDKYNSL